MANKNHELTYDYRKVDGMPESMNHVPHKIPVAQGWRSENEMSDYLAETITGEERAKIISFMAREGQSDD